MKSIKKNDGYIMVYVLVVVLVVSLAAVAACTAAIRNFKSQNTALNYTQDKYAAQGVVERFVAELKDAAVEVAEDVAEDVGKNEGQIKSMTTYDSPMQSSTYVGSGDYIKLSIQDGIEKAGIVGSMINAGLDIEVNGTPIEFKNHTYQEKNATTGVIETFVDDDSGYFEMKMRVSGHYGQVKIDTEITFGFEASVKTKDGNDYFSLSDVFCGYTSYEVTPTTGR